MNGVREAGVCPACGTSLGPDGACRICARQGRPLTLGGEAGVLALLSAIAIVFFLLTGLAVASYRNKEERLAKEWKGRGEAFLRASQPDRAVEAFQNSLRYGPQAQEVRYDIVDSLLAAGRSEQARSYLLSLWERQPANGLINLDLARIAAGRGDVASATTYYHNAIYGVWDTAPQQNRLQARLELIRFLLHHQEPRDADAELVALAANAPSSPELAKQVGDLFLQAGDPDSAFDRFASAAKDFPQHPEFLAAAGKAAFEQGRYDVAFQYLQKGHQADSNDPEAERLWQLTRLILENDPFDRRVSWQTRSDRALAALALAQQRLQDCAGRLAGSPGPPPAELTAKLDELASVRKRASVHALRRDPDLLLQYSHLAFSAEELAARLCGPPQGADQALLLIGRRHPEVQP